MIANRHFFRIFFITLYFNRTIVELKYNNGRGLYNA